MLRSIVKSPVVARILSIGSTPLLGLYLIALGLANVPHPLSAQSNEPPPLKFEALRTIYKRSNEIYTPPENPSTAAKEQLGKILFFDSRLSGTNSMSCSTCHNPTLGWSDGLARALGDGGKTLNRRTPSLLNVGLLHHLQWDSEFNLLEEQALAPIRKKTEMNQDLQTLPTKIAAIKGYVPLFNAAFPGEPITVINIARALAAFERTIVSGVSPFERFLNGDDNAMSTDAKLGAVLFRGKARCGACHMSWTFTDGSPYDIGHKGTDWGIGALSKNEWDRFKFKNPALLDVAIHPPYMHDGSLPDLAAVIEFYDRGGDVKRPTVSSDIVALHLSSQEKSQLLAFLNSLTSARAEFKVPDLPE